MIEVLLTYRAKVFSPNNVEKDAAILQKVAQKLSTAGCSVREFSETEITEYLLGCKFTETEKSICKSDTLQQIVVGMPRLLKTLLQIKVSGIKCYNHISGIINVATSRELTLSLLSAAGISVPEWWAYDPEEDEMFQCEQHLQTLLPAWVKAMRHNGVRHDDVVFVNTPLEADSEIIRLASENAQDIVVMKHLNGDLIKVYAVTNALGEVKFIKWFYPQENGYTKFGDEAYNDDLQHFAFSENACCMLAEKISQTLDLQFFGFDAIVGKDNTLSVIDVNDWPSYSICQDEAAEEIARTILADTETY